MLIFNIENKRQWQIFYNDGAMQAKFRLLVFFIWLTRDIYGTCACYSPIEDIIPVIEVRRIMLYVVEMISIFSIIKRDLINFMFVSPN